MLVTACQAMVTRNDLLIHANASARIRPPYSPIKKCVPEEKLFNFNGSLYNTSIVALQNPFCKTVFFLPP
jgi:hypothetical protein